MTRVRLTSEAAARFPELANRTGTVLHTLRHAEWWERVAWDSAVTAWMPRDDLEPLPPPTAPEPTP